eukprot:2779325-Pyramimonas_sp.AAC.1
MSHRLQLFLDLLQTRRRPRVVATRLSAPSASVCLGRRRWAVRADGGRRPCRLRGHGCSRFRSLSKGITSKFWVPLVLGCPTWSKYVLSCFD